VGASILISVGVRCRPCYFSIEITSVNCQAEISDLLALAVGLGWAVTCALQMFLTMPTCGTESIPEPCSLLLLRATWLREGNGSGAGLASRPRLFLWHSGLAQAGEKGGIDLGLDPRHPEI
jgi:hypothetical protein